MAPLRGRMYGTRSRCSPLYFLSASAFLLILSIVPCLGLYRLNQTHPALFPGLLVYLFSVNLLTCIVYYDDKCKSRSGGWRTSERTLHFCELAGGWPAAFVSQRWFRHKISKLGYQVVFWLIVLVNEVVLVDVMMDGAMRRWVLEHCRME